MAEIKEIISVALHKTEISFPENDSEIQSLPQKNIYGNFITGFDVTTEEEDQKRKKRATRFGSECQKLHQELNPAEKDEHDQFEQKKHERLLRFGPTESQNKIDGSKNNDETVLPSYKVEGDIRLNVLHIHGTDEMSTKNVLHYFEKFPPGRVEWINDSSCNVVWDDENTTKRAYNAKSQEFLPKTLLKVQENDTINASDDKPVVDKLKWRLGKPCPEAKQLLIRYATINDKKIKGIAKYSNYYLKYGNPNQSGRGRGIITQTRKRKNREGQQKLSSSDHTTADDGMEIDDVDHNNNDIVNVDENYETMEVDSVPDTKRMRMRADEEGENKLKGTDLRLLLKCRRKNERHLAMTSFSNESRLNSKIMDN